MAYRNIAMRRTDIELDCSFVRLDIERAVGNHLVMEPGGYAVLDATFHALADPTRRAILARLTTGEASVTELAAPFQMSQPAISKHLKVLEKAGLISRGRDAQRRPCRLEARPLRDATAWLADFRLYWEESFQRLDALLESRLPRTEKTTAHEPHRDHADRPRDRAHPHVRRSPPSCVFDAYTRPELLTQWYGARGWHLVGCDFDLREGGPTGSTSRGPAGETMVQAGTVRLRRGARSGWRSPNSSMTSPIRARP